MEQRHAEHLFVTVKDGEGSPSKCEVLNCMKSSAFNIYGLALPFKQSILEDRTYFPVMLSQSLECSHCVWNLSAIGCLCQSPPVNLGGAGRKDEDTFFLLVQYRWFSMNSHMHLFADGVEPIITILGGMNVHQSAILI